MQMGPSLHGHVTGVGNNKVACLNFMPCRVCGINSLCMFLSVLTAVHNLRHLVLQTEVNELHDSHSLKNGPCSSCLLFTALILL